MKARIKRATACGVAAAALCLAAAVGCGDQRNQFAPPPPPKVNVAKPQAMPVAQYLEFTGNTAAVETVELRARVKGFLQSAPFADGAPVKKGEVLFVIDPRQYKASQADAEAEQSNQQAKLTRAETELARAQKLFSEKAGPQSEVVRWQNERDSAQAGIASAKARIEMARLDLGYTQVAAPFDGRVGRRLVDPGNLVGAGENTKLATVVRTDPMYAYFTINERDLQRFRERGGRKDAPLEMGLAEGGGFPFKGRLDFADVTLEPQSGTLLLRGVFPNSDNALLPGMFVRVRAQMGVHEQALTVPEASLGLDQAGRFVLVVGDKNAVERRGVAVGATQNGMAEIVSGLGPDDRVVVAGLMRARPGDVVDPVMPQPAGQDGQPGAPAKPDAGKAEPAKPQAGKQGG